MPEPLSQEILLSDSPVIVHASTVAFKGKALLITGGSGTGKSSLALEMMALGAALVADDRTILTRQDGQVIAGCPEAISGQIEARGIGILNATPAGPTPLAAVLDLDTEANDRLPAFQEKVLLGQRLPLLHKTGMTAFPAALMQYLSAGRRE